MTKQNHSLHRCPFWSELSRKCSISRKGLFVPLYDQISNYCTSENHRNCSQYKEELLSLQVETEAVPINRRNHPRTTSEHPLNLNFINEAGCLIQQTAGIARTINLSVGGMQIRTRGPLFHDCIVRFSYEKSGISPPRHGLAKVKWCNYHLKIMRYTAGLSFYRLTALPADLSNRLDLT
ncbi:PilZ domain-containing protein [Desulfopila inferna]|uniref:PilZ domain-containing protein n=1 Tax=Desulfopila inferna TaxID=468528 RepID=UPI001962F9B9|nr:PilZ domain-containing protein [Desulfopila inferna]MBM9603194.1 PilZ domain-containing protein [Desulfopila inferna]